MFGVDVLGLDALAAQILRFFLPTPGVFSLNRGGLAPPSLSLPKIRVWVPWSHTVKPGWLSGTVGTQTRKLQRSPNAHFWSQWKTTTIPREDPRRRAKQTMNFGFQPLPPDWSRRNSFWIPWRPVPSHDHQKTNESQFTKKQVENRWEDNDENSKTTLTKVPSSPCQFQPRSLPSLPLDTQTRRHTPPHTHHTTPHPTPSHPAGTRAGARAGLKSCFLRVVDMSFFRVVTRFLFEHRWTGFLFFFVTWKFVVVT